MAWSESVAMALPAWGLLPAPTLGAGMSAGSLASVCGGTLGSGPWFVNVPSDVAWVTGSGVSSIPCMCLKLLVSASMFDTWSSVSVCKGPGFFWSIRSAFAKSWTAMVASFVGVSSGTVMLCGRNCEVSTVASRPVVALIAWIQR